jgi:tetratricopeptide (TPR) repeat protein
VALTASGEGLVRAMAMKALGNAIYYEGEFELAIPRFEEAVAEMEALRDAGHDSFDRDQLLELAVLYGDIANCQKRLARFEEAERSLDRSARLAAELPRGDPTLLGRIASMRGDLAGEWKGDQEAAVRFYREAVRLHREAGLPYQVADTLNGLASHLMFAGELEESRRLFEESLQITREVWGDRSPRTAIVLENLGNIYSRMSNYDHVAELLEEVLSIRVEVFGENNAVYMTKHNLGYNKLMSGDAAGGLALIEESLRGLRGLYPESNELILGAVINRGRCLLALHDLEAAQLDFEEASAIADALELGPTARLRLNADLEMSKTLCLQGATARGRGLAESAVERLDPETMGHQRYIDLFAKQLSECGAD